MVARIVGPIDGGAHGWPFSASMADLDGAGYVQEEYFLEGDATAYELEPGAEYGVDGRWAVRPSRTAPFRTRILVVRPVDPAHFNGTVVVNWQNVTAGFEIGSVPVDLMTAGYAWVGASVQKVGIDGGPATGAAIALKGWDAERYGTLDHPGDDFSFDLFTQAAQAVGPARGSTAPDPMGGLNVEKLLAYGASQSAIRLRAYIDAIHPVAGVFDGFFLRVDFGIGSHVDSRRGGSNILEDSDDEVLTVQGAMVPARIRDDLDVPVLVLNSESEAPMTYPVRQPDTDRYRLWEVAGTAHSGGPAATEELTRQLEREGIADAFGPASLGRVAPDDPNVVSFAAVDRAAMDHMQRWLTTGTPPPAQPLIEFEPGRPPRFRRDEWGNALGGIRVPEFEVPTGEHHGLRADNHPLGALSGMSRPFSTDELRDRYPNAAAYVKAYEEAVDRAVSDGVVRAEEAPAMKETAAATAASLITW
jgi:hypothetical protein